MGNGVKLTFEMFDNTFYKSQQTKSKFETQKLCSERPQVET